MAINCRAKGRGSDVGRELDHSYRGRGTCCGLEGPQVRLPRPVTFLHSAAGPSMVFEDRVAVATADVHTLGLSGGVGDSLPTTPSRNPRYYR